MFLTPSLTFRAHDVDRERPVLIVKNGRDIKPQALETQNIHARIGRLSHKPTNAARATTFQYDKSEFYARIATMEKDVTGRCSPIEVFGEFPTTLLGFTIEDWISCIPDEINAFASKAKKTVEEEDLDFVSRQLARAWHEKNRLETLIRRGIAGLLLMFPIIAGLLIRWVFHQENLTVSAVSLLLLINNLILLALVWRK